MGGSKGSSTTQEQTVTQSTSVNVTNVIDNTRVLDPLEKLKLLADVFSQMDQIEIEKKKAGTPGAVVSLTNIPASAYLTNPLTLSIIIGGVLLTVLLIKKGNKT